MKTERREGLSADCLLNPMVVTAILLKGGEHPCDRCNHDRSKCRGFPRIDENCSGVGEPLEVEL